MTRGVKRREGNRLGGATSPYLLLHAGDPVHWWEWGEEALERAREEDKLILLSVGYAACHWCHVMAKESFADEGTAKIMNEGFISVKVDREERPDVDARYMNALQLTGRSGGWPLTMILAPDAAPLGGGTYFPPERRHGLPSFQEVLEGALGLWRERRGEAREWADKMRAALARLDEPPGGETQRGEAAAAARETLGAVDKVNGGFGGAPKFPETGALSLLATCGHDEAVERAVEALRRSGARDHVDGGFARYCVDERWDVPHFEKTLYDAALLLRVFAGLYRMRPSASLEALIRETARATREQLGTRQGALASSLDADSRDADGRSEEGAFYSWTASEIKEALGEAAAEKFLSVYALCPIEGGERCAVRLRLEATYKEELSMKESRRRLRETRASRESPPCDDKIIAEWNALAAAGLADAAAALDDAPMAAGAFRLMRAARRALRHAGVLRRAVRWTQGGEGLIEGWSAGTEAFAADRAAFLLAEAMLAGIARTPRTCEAAYRRAEEMWQELEGRHGDGDGGLLDAARGRAEEGELERAALGEARTLFDTPTPSATATALEGCARLWLLTGVESWRKRAQDLWESMGSAPKERPSRTGYAWCGALLLEHGASVHVSGFGKSARRLLSRARSGAHGALVCAPLTPTNEAHDAREDLQSAAQQETRAETPRAYLCARERCSAPIESEEALAAGLEEEERERRRVVS